MKVTVPKLQRCAIFTRKSTEHSLDRASHPVAHHVPVVPAAGLHQDLMARFLCWHIQEQAQGPSTWECPITYPWNNFHQTGVLLVRWSRSLK